MINSFSCLFPSVNVQPLIDLEFRGYCVGTGARHRSIQPATSLPDYRVLLYKMAHANLRTSGSLFIR